MGRIRLNKVLRDLWVARGRMALMVGAVATSLVAAGATQGRVARNLGVSRAAVSRIMSGQRRRSADPPAS